MSIFFSTFGGPDKITSRKRKRRSDKNRRLRFRLVKLAILTFALLSGCGRDTGLLTGAVTLDGKSVANGMVAVRTEDGRAANGNIENGIYRIPDAPLGKVLLMVQSVPPPPAVVPPGAKVDPVKPAAYVAIPERFNEFATSNLSTTVIAGENKLDLKLEK
jgi:hypothetical protein